MQDGGVDVGKGEEEEEEEGKTRYLSLQGADEHAVEDFARFVGVAYVFECFG